ncbi:MULTISPECIES: MazG nucleotide pyrophosphohydrolase domain-containing protein [unclassified Methylophaga]|jgi:ATP diphosphatase|uniref:MazG nucleotide pyrophosphohydrolase domain-containing protein n=1 Tax=unclassified Methylophaga TaxID=2629249 RepID=UPI0025F23FA1|nr:MULTISPECIES: MazG nucleotide pyrophosphohydrolase domain-containing protein [unclassified Methylophaga]|tara:strand:- start:3316 stop:3732 length:417 start_codon:yes stop_codon:yes gene_type:complete
MSIDKSSLLASADKELPALQYAVELQKTAAQIGFDWPHIDGVIAKIHEELDEVAAELDDRDQTKLQEEIGDLLFAITNLARHLNIDPQQAIQQCNQKFLRRFRYIETQIFKQQKTLKTASLDELDALWDEAKSIEKKN